MRGMTIWVSVKVTTWWIGSMALIRISDAISGELPPRAVPARGRGATGRVGRWWIAAWLMALSVVPMAGDARAAALPVSGTWIIRDLVLRIFDCESRVCGRIVWLRNPARRPSQCGLTIVWGLTAKGPNEWDEGSILDPDKQTVYRLSARFEPDGTLHARIFKGVPLLGRTEVLRRVDLREYSGQC